MEEKKINHANTEEYTSYEQMIGLIAHKEYLNGIKELLDLSYEDNLKNAENDISEIVARL